MKTSAAIGALAAIISQAAANLDVVTLFANSDAYIQEASATLVVGDIPNPITGDVALWSAIMMENEASFLQGVTENAPAGYGVATAFQQFGHGAKDSQPGILYQPWKQLVQLCICAHW